MQAMASSRDWPQAPPLERAVETDTLSWPSGITVDDLDSAQAMEDTHPVFSTKAPPEISSVEELCQVACGQSCGKVIDLDGRTLPLDGFYAVVENLMSPSNNQFELDLCGPGTTIRNGELVLAANLRLVVNSSDGVALSDVKITCTPGTDKMPGASLEFKGARCNATLTDVHLEGCNLITSDGATAHLTNCHLTKCKAAAVAALGRRTHVSLSNCSVSGANGPAVEVSQGARAEVRSCTTTACRLGLRVVGSGSSALAHDCRFAGSAVHGVGVRGGACVSMTGCCVTEAGVHGLVATGAFSAVRAEGCKFTRNARCGVVMTERARVRLVGCVCDESAGMAGEAFSGDGVVVSGMGSHVDAKGCSFSGNLHSGVYVLAQGCGSLIGCILEGNKMYNGVAANGGHVSAEGCRFLGNAAEAVSAFGGGCVDALKCDFSRPGGGVALLAKDAGSACLARLCHFALQTVSQQHSGGTVTAEDCLES